MSTPSQYPKKKHAEISKNCDVIIIHLFDELENNANLSILIKISLSHTTEELYLCCSLV
jgi:hypothetical protein